MKLSDREQERLSAALDGALSAEEQAALDAELAANDALRAEWEELSATRVLLQQLQPLVPPRSFTLDPHSYGRRSFWSGAWVRWAGCAEHVSGAVFGRLVIVVGCWWHC